ncbi:hypothetical protein JYU34_003812, partial [Plutella xylostella]
MKKVLLRPKSKTLADIVSDSNTREGDKKNNSEWELVQRKRLRNRIEGSKGK